MLVFAVPVVAFLLIAALGRWNHVAGWNAAWHYGVFLALLLGAVAVGGSSAPRLLALFGFIIIALLFVGMNTSGEWAMWTVLSVGLFCSVMWSNIFSLAIEGLGPLKSQASSLLVMAILGGALLPPLQGALADRIGVQDHSSCQFWPLPTWRSTGSTDTGLGEHLRWRTLRCRWKRSALCGGGDPTADAQPFRRARARPFQMDRAEAANARFAVFVAAAGHINHPGWAFYAPRKFPRSANSIACVTRT